MKNTSLKIIHFVILTFLSLDILAQCLENGITTNPDKTVWENPPYNSNYKKNSGSNFFDWRQEYFPVSITSFPYSQVTSPYYFGATATALVGLAQGENNPDKYDFYPQDGWELIRKNFGLRADGSIITNEAMIGPYYILYNKYTSTLRVIGWTGTAVGFFPTLNVKISFSDNAKTSGLFSFYNAIAKPLDQFATNHATTPVALTGDPLVPFFADFKLAYDPCTCLFESTIKVEFTKVQTMNIDLHGKLLATSIGADTYESLVGNGNAMYDKDFLTSVFDNDVGNPSDLFKVTTGIMSYRSIDKLVTDFKTSAEAAKNKEQLKKSLDFTVSILQSKDYVEGLTKTVGYFISTISDMFAAEPGVPSSFLSVIHGEMALTGQIINNSDQHIAIPLANPGSVNSNTAVECCATGPYYPMYNEVLGVFALLKTPEISLNTTTANGMVTTTFQLATPLQYMFNPAVKVNLAHSRIYTSFEAETAGGVSGLNFFESYTAYNKYKQKWITKFASPALPIESMTFAKMQYYGVGNIATPTLSVILDLEFQTLNRQGSPNRSLMVLTFPTKIINTSSTPSSLITGYAQYLTIPTTSYSASTTIGAWNDITITGNQTASPTINPITIAAGGEVVIQPGVSLGSKLILQAGAYPANAFTSWIYPQPVNKYLVPQTSIDCTAGSYKANKANATAREAGYNIDDREEDKSLGIYPNPANSKIVVNFSLSRDENVEITLLNVSGDAVKHLLSQFMEKGFHELEINTTELLSGLYLVRLRSDSYNKSEKLIIIK